MSDATLVERLGHPAGTRLIIVNCDDLGSSQSANAAIWASLRDGMATTATVMVPCPWAADAAAQHQDEEVGVHLTLTSEWAGYRWRPLTSGASLRDADGFLPRTTEQVWRQADLAEVRAELEAQIDQARKWGIDVTHLDSHMGTNQLREEFFTVYVELAVTHGLPLRMAGTRAEDALGFAFRTQAASAGVVFTDHLIAGGSARSMLDRVLDGSRPGVTEIFGHPALDTPELRAFAPDHATRIDDHRVFTSPETLAAIEAAGVHLIGYRALRDLQRGG